VYAALNLAPNVAPRDAQGNWTKLAITSDRVQNPLADLMEVRNPRRTTRIISNTPGGRVVYEVGSGSYRFRVRVR
jgi:hypothetical protein